MIESSTSVQWLRRYRLFFVAGLLLLIIQLMLGYLLPIFGTTDDIYNQNAASIYSNLIEARNAYQNQAAFDELFQDEPLSFDDDDIDHANAIIIFKDLTTGGGLALPKIVVASSAKGSINNHHQIISDHPNDNIVNVRENANRKPNENTKLASAASAASASASSSSSLSPSSAASAAAVAAPETNLKLSNLKFKPVCDIVAKEAISAIYRAHTRYCKEIIANTTCAIQSGTFYPMQLPNYCPHEPYQPNRALGCFKDDKKFRTLSGYYINFKTTNTPAKCIQLCLQSGFVYAGVQYSWVMKKTDKPETSCSLLICF